MAARLRPSMPPFSAYSRPSAVHAKALRGSSCSERPRAYSRAAGFTAAQPNAAHSSADAGASRSPPAEQTTPGKQRDLTENASCSERLRAYSRTAGFIAAERRPQLRGRRRQPQPTCTGLGIPKDRCTCRIACSWNEHFAGSAASVQERQWGAPASDSTADCQRNTHHDRPQWTNL